MTDIDELLARSAAIAEREPGLAAEIAEVRRAMEAHAAAYKPLPRLWPMRQEIRAHERWQRRNDELRQRLERLTDADAGGGG